MKEECLSRENILRGSQRLHPLANNVSMSKQLPDKLWNSSLKIQSRAICERLLSCASGVVLFCKVYERNVENGCIKIYQISYCPEYSVVGLYGCLSLQLRFSQYKAPALFATEHRRNRTAIFIDLCWHSYHTSNFLINNCNIYIRDFPIRAVLWSCWTSSGRKPLQAFQMGPVVSASIKMTTEPEYWLCGLLLCVICFFRAHLRTQEDRIWISSWTAGSTS